MAERNENKITYFAETNFRNKRVKFGIKPDDRRRHIYAIGKTGMGKSTILENMFMDDVYSGSGACFVDPHGDTVERFLNYIPPERINDVIYFNPSDIDFPIAFNILESVDPSLQHIVASGLLGVFKKLWADSWGPRLEYVLRNAILALLDYPGSTLLGVLRIFNDKDYRKKVVEKVRDPVVKSFWLDEYERYPDKLKAEAIAPIQNKVGQFLANFLIRNIVGQVKSTIDMREAMDNGKLVLLNLSKGRIGEDTSALLGAMMITKIQLAAMSRVDTSEDDRRDFYLYVDEFQNFATESFATILSEARKYRLCLNLAHQYIEQLDERVSAAVFGNVGSILCFRVGAADAEFLVKEFEPVFTEQDIVNIKKYDLYLKLMIDGVASEPFSATGLPPFYTYRPKMGNQEKVIRVSRERYAKPRDIVEDKIIRWSAGVQVVAGQQGEGGGKRFGGPRENTFNRGPRASENKPLVRNTMTQGASSSVNTRKRNQESSANGPSNYLGYVAKQQAQKGLKVEKDLPTRDEDIPSGSRQNATQCWSCNKLTYTSFVPDGKRPVYCKNCLHEIRTKRAEERPDRAAIRPMSDAPRLMTQERHENIATVRPAASTPRRDERVQSARPQTSERKAPVGQKERTQRPQKPAAREQREKTPKQQSPAEPRKQPPAATQQVAPKKPMNNAPKPLHPGEVVTFE